MNNILDFWPFPFEPRPNQITALEWLAKSTKKYKLLEAPVGSGKSAIALTYSLYVGNRKKSKRGDSYILTPQRVLQKQYETSMSDIRDIELASLFGRNNYKCASKSTTCDIGFMVKEPKCSGCPYKKAKQFAIEAANTVTNYRMASLLFQFGGTNVVSRQLMVMDECHNIEDVLIDMDAVRVTYTRCEKYKLPFKQHREIQSALVWIKDAYFPKLRDICDKKQTEIEYLLDKPGTEISKHDVYKLKEVDVLLEHLDGIVEMTLRKPEYVEKNFVLCFDPTMFQFKRLYGAYSFNRIFEPKAEEFLFMSSTILNKSGFCNDLGLADKDTDFLSLSSEFPVKNRRVTYIPKMKMNAKWNDPENKKDRSNMFDAIQAVLKMHTDDKGLIHTGNFRIAEWVVAELKKSKETKHHIYHHNPDSGDDRNAVISAFMNDTKPSILISPSSTEGLDLKDDLSRFAVFVKVPFGYLGDQWIKKRMNISNAWYQRKALIDIIQGGGRIVRSETDWGNVYILDGSWAYLYKMASGMVPKWWKAAYECI